MASGQICEGMKSGLGNPSDLNRQKPVPGGSEGI